MKVNKTLLIVGLVGVIVIIGIIIGSVVVGNVINNLKTSLSDALATKTNIITSDTVVDKIEQVSELTTTKYTIQLVAKNETVGGWLLLGTTNVKMLLIAKGTVRAGLDLAKLDASAVTVSGDGKSVTVHLPQVKIFDRDHILSSNPSDTRPFAEK